MFSKFSKDQAFFLATHLFFQLFYGLSIAWFTAFVYQNHNRQVDLLYQSHQLVKTMAREVEDCRLLEPEDKTFY